MSIKIPAFLWGKSIQTDSRSVTEPAETVFVARRGTWHDGHDYVAALYGRGVRAFVVERAVSLPEDAEVYEVADSLVFLQAFARAYRAQFSLYRIGITGSNGKTICKEWLAALLQLEYAVVKSPKSYNSQLGVPLSLLEIRAHHEVGIFEAGVSRAGEMAALAALIEPELGIFTTLGSAHDAGFASSHEKLEEKLMLFESTKVLIYNTAVAGLEDALRARGWFETKDLVGWSVSDASARVHVSYTRIGTGRTQIDIDFLGRKSVFEVPFSVEVDLENCVHVILAALFMKVSTAHIQEALGGIQTVRMRLEWKEAQHASLLLDDTYNNDLSGLRVALEALASKQPARRRIVCLSDLLETGLPKEILYREVAHWLRVYEVNQLHAVGPALAEQAQQFSFLDAYFYKDTEEAEQQLPEFKAAHILVKGARCFAFERIVRRLQCRHHRSILALDLDALRSNLSVYKAHVAQDTRVMVMVKALAYGSDGPEVARFLAYQGVDYLGVAYTDEGIRLREGGVKTPIFVMNPHIEEQALLWAYHLEPALYKEEQLTLWSKQASVYPLRVHVEIDTGMHRLGFSCAEAEALIPRLKNSGLHVESIFTHMSVADESTQVSFSRQQIDSFKQIVRIYKGAFGAEVWAHMANSSGILRFPEAHFEGVRLGIGLHGFDPTGLCQERLQPVAQFKTVISQIRTLSAGDAVGYGRRQRLSRESRIATLAVGYADGVDRRLGEGRGQVYLHGQYAPFVGRICMDMSFVDVTHIKQAKENDSVLLFGEGVTVQNWAAWLDTIPYEVLTGISSRIPRVLVM